MTQSFNSSNSWSALLSLMVKWDTGQRKLLYSMIGVHWTRTCLNKFWRPVLLDKIISGEIPGSKMASRLSFHFTVVLFCIVFQPCSERWVVPDLLIGFAADLEHLLALDLQLFSQSADILVECVDLVVQLSDVVLPPGDLLLQLGDPAQQLTLLGLKKKKKSDQWCSCLKSWGPTVLFVH